LNKNANYFLKQYSRNSKIWSRAEN